MNSCFDKFIFIHEIYDSSLTRSTQDGTVFIERKIHYERTPLKLDTKTNTFTSSVDSVDAVQMLISAEGVGHILSLLTNLYNDPQLAVIREYTTNAWDSHVEAGQTKPVEVYLPSWSEPTFTVKDYGVGMDENTIKTVFAIYGESTKRDTDTQSGAFGLGCKSALATASQFSVLSVKDGIKYSVIISAGENGINSTNIVQKTLTDEPNGVTVKVPIDNVTDFREKARKFYSYSKEGSVLVDNLKPDSIRDGDYAFKFDVPGSSEQIIIHENDRYYQKETTIVMGGVPYKIPTEKLNEIKESNNLNKIQYTFCAGIEIGSVDLTPNREGLRYTAKTVNTIVEVLKFINDGITQKIQENITNATGIFSAYAASRSGAYSLGLDLEYKGLDLLSNARIKGSDVSFANIYLGLYGKNEYEEHPYMHCGSLFGDSTSKYFIVGKRTTKKLSTYANDFARYFKEHRAHLFFIEDINESFKGNEEVINLLTTDPEVLERTHTYEEYVNLAKEYRKTLPKKPREPKEATERYADCVVVDVASKVSTAKYIENLEKDFGNNISYLMIDAFPSESRITDLLKGYRVTGIYRNDEVVDGKSALDFISKLAKTDYVVVLSSSTRLEKTKLILPDIKDMSLEFLKYKKTMVSKINAFPEEVRNIYRYSLHFNVKSIKSLLNGKNILDKEIGKYVSPSKSTLNKIEVIDELEMILKFVDGTYNLDDGARKLFHTSDKVDKIICDRYPLLRNMNMHTMDISSDHIRDYMNSTYKTWKKNFTNI